MPELNNRRGKPLYRQLEALLEKQIQNAQYAPGEMIPSDRQLCKEYNVSYLTARQAVGELVKRGLLTRKQGKGTFIAQPKEFQPGIRNIALVCTSGVTMFQEYYGVIIDGMEEVFRSAGYSVQLFFTDGESLSNPRNQLFQELVSSSRLSGVVLLEPLPSQEINSLLEGNASPLVSIMKYKRLDYPAVVVDYKKAAYTLTRHLIGLGHRRIGLMIKPLDLGGSEIVRGSNLVHEGYREALASEGISYDDALVLQAPNNAAAAAELVKDFFNLRTQMTAVVCGAQALLQAAATEANRHSLRIPDDLSLAGVVEEEFDQRYTAVVAPTRKIGLVAAQTMVRLVNGENLRAEDVKPLLCELREGSTVSPPGSAPRITGRNSRR